MHRLDLVGSRVVDQQKFAAITSRFRILWQFCEIPGSWFNIKMTSYKYRKFHCGDKTEVISSYLRNGISYTGKMPSLYWIEDQMFVQGVISKQSNSDQAYDRWLCVVNCTSDWNFWYIVPFVCLMWTPRLKKIVDLNFIKVANYVFGF